MFRLIVLMLPLAVAACGADGPPVRPSAAEAQPQDGVRISGDARIGIVTQLD